MSVAVRSRDPEHRQPRSASSGRSLDDRSVDNRSVDNRPVAARPAARWSIDTSMTAWCQTCGADVQFVAPAGVCPADLAADERGCVWCGEALTVTVGVGVSGQPADEVG